MYVLVNSVALVWGEGIQIWWPHYKTIADRVAKIRNKNFSKVLVENSVLWLILWRR